VEKKEEKFLTGMGKKKLDWDRSIIRVPYTTVSVERFITNVGK